MGRKMLIYSALLLLAVITGIITGCLGQPYNTAVFALHKIISIGAIIIAIIFIRRQIKETGISSAVRNSIIVLSISALVLLATGALMSIGVGPFNIVRTFHMFTPVIAAAMIICANILLGRKRQEKASSPDA